MKLKVWMAQNAQGQYLCLGNPNPHLSYSMGYPFDEQYLCSERWLMCRTRYEAEEHIRKWHEQSKRAVAAHPRNVLFERRYWYCRPVRIEVSWELAKRGAVRK